MKKNFIIQLIILAASLLLLYYTLKNENFDEIIISLRKSEWWWFFPVFIVTFLGNFIRALRWRLLLRTNTITPSIFNTFLSLMSGYFVSFLVPRLGELTRCISLKKTESIPIEYSIGTVISERIVDILSILFITLGTFFLYYETVSVFFIEYIFPTITQFFNSKLYTGIAAMTLFSCMIILFFVLPKQLHKRVWWKYLLPILYKLKEGVLSVFRSNQLLLFICYTIIIWICYFLSTYCWFFGYEPFNNLGVQEALILLVAGTVARSFPIQGQGAGIYNIMIAQTVILFGKASKDGFILSILIYITQTAFYFVVGALCALIVLFQPKSHE